MKSLLLIFLLFLASSGITKAEDALHNGFLNPPPAAKARTWWHWLNGNVTKAGITADLEAMKKVGIQEAQIFNVNLGHPKGPAAYASPKWLDLFKHAALQAERLGLDLAFHNGPGWSSSGGPWITPEHSMQTLVYSETTVEGNSIVVAQLEQPETRLNFYRDVAIVAFPKLENDTRVQDLDIKNLSGRVRNHLMPQTKLIPKSAIIDSAAIIDLTAKVTDKGLLNWKAPPGRWTVLRMGHTSTGKKNHPAVAGGQGLECNKMSREAVDEFWKGGIEPIIKKLGPLAGTVVNNCLIDSYEVGTANWTAGLPSEFRRLRGYDCFPFLPTLAGYYVDGGEITERFLWDFRRTLGDLMTEHYYAHFRDRCHEHGMQFSVEPYWGPFDNMQVGETGDIVMCEFWSGNLAFFDSPKFVASIAKLNGSSIVGAESFTGTGGWTQHPATIKSIGDRAWAQGINRFIFHTYAHQPWDVGPGITLGPYGLDFNRLNTWWNQGSAFLEYIARSQFLLQQGKTVADVLVFTGEASPNNAVLLPQIKSKGYDYDLIGSNKIQSLSVVDGMICTSAGDRYPVLVLPKTTWMRPETLRKFAALAESGATILGPQPKRSPSLQDYPQCDQHVCQLAQTLWESGKIKDDSILHWLGQSKLPADFAVEGNGPNKLDFIHRRTSNAEIYFLANADKESQQRNCRFRVSGMQPQQWNAETGEVNNIAVWKDNGDGTTSIPIQFDPEESIFVIFGTTTSISPHLVKTDVEVDPQQAMPLANLEVIKAEYGTFMPKGLVDVTDVVAREIKNNAVEVIANRSLCDCDPAPGYKKELRVKYSIGDYVQETHASERESIAIDADGGGELKVLRAVFGKFSGTTRSLPAETNAQDVTQRIQSLIDDGVYEIPVDDPLIGGGQREQQNLQIVFSSDGATRERLVPEGGTLKLTRDPPQSYFIAEGGRIHWVTPRPGQANCRLTSGKTKLVRVESVPERIGLNGPWDVSFPIKLGPTADTKFNELDSWSSSADQRVRYFSGTASYQKEFKLPEELLQSDISLELDLGSVRVIAEVIVNGKNLGILWKAPFKVNLDGCARVGKNQLEVQVTNLWPNRLIGDEQFPEDTKRRGPHVKQWPDWLLNQTDRPSNRISFAGFKHWDKQSPLQASGLLGPVVIQPYQRAVVR